MTFKTDGSPHRSGIENEARIAEMLNKQGVIKNVYPNFPSTARAQQMGGTKHKQDISIFDGSDEIKKISVKEKSKGTKIGSYDWINSSAAVREISALQEYVDGVNQARIYGRSKEEVKEEVRENLNALSCGVLNSLTPSQIKSILVEQVCEKYTGIDLVISDRKEEEDYLIDFGNTPLNHAIMNYTPSFEPAKQSGQTSRKIVFTDQHGSTYDYGLRFRLVLNNGVGALLGLSKSNNNSQPVIKIQQDKVSKLIERNISTNNCIKL
jgi:hypothetical protein